MFLNIKNAVEDTISETKSSLLEQKSQAFIGSLTCVNVCRGGL